MSDLNDVPVYSQSPEISSPPQASLPPVPPPAPVSTFVPPRPKSSILPLIFGFLVVIILAAVIGVVYYKNKLTVSSSPTPKPTSVSTSTPEPSVSPSSKPSGSIKPSVKPTSKPSLKPSLKPVSAIKDNVVLASPTATPATIPTLDIRFGNPSANVKQTYDDGSGSGRVINREYSSIQSGQFDEVQASWSPRVTVCFHIVSNEVIAGKDLKFALTVDDKVEVEDNLGQYDKLEVGRLYDWCHDVTTGIGSHTAKLTINGDKSLKELNYVNNLARVDWENLADKIAPNFTIGGPYDWTTNGTCFIIPSAPTDNVTPLSALKVEQKVDGGAWSPIIEAKYCFIGTAGSAHTYTVHVIDARGNANEQTKAFVLY